MSKYTDRFNEAYLHNLGRTVASIVAALRDDHPDVADSFETALGSMAATAEQFPTGNPMQELHALRTLAEG